MIRAAVEQHAAEDGEIGCRTEKARVTRDPAHPSRGRIVDDAAQPGRPGTLAGPAERRAVLGRGDAAAKRRRRKKHRVLHTERREDSIVHKPIEWLSTDPSHDIAEKEVVDIAVNEPLPWSRCRHFFDGELDGFFRSAPRVSQIDVGAKSGHVGHQVPDRDVLLAISLESRNERRDAIGESDLSFFEKDHDARRRSDDLGERGKIEDRVHGH